jgi:hypothetical protein
MDYKKKYLKYKTKYLNLQNIVGGNNINDLLTIMMNPDREENIRKIIKTYIINDNTYVFTLIYDPEYNKKIELQINNKINNFEMLLNIFEICYNKLFAELIDFNIGNETSDIIEQLFNMCNLEYIIDKNKFIVKIRPQLHIIEILNTNIIITNQKYEQYKILVDFNLIFGMCNKEINKRKYEPDIDYSINLLWINKKKYKDKCILLLDEDIYELFDDKKDYTKIIKDKLKQNIFIFEEDGINFNLNEMTYTKNSNTNKIFKINHIQNIYNWSNNNPKNKVNLWYDSGTIEINTFIETILLFNDFNEKNINNYGIYLRDIRNTSNFQNIYDRINIGFKYKENTPDEITKIVNLYISIYYRVDFGRLMIMEQILKENTYFIYADLDMIPINQQQIFTLEDYDNIKQEDITITEKKEVLAKIDQIGFIPGFQNNGFENGFFICGSKEKTIKDFLINYINKFLLIEKEFVRISDFYEITDNKIDEYNDLFNESIYRMMDGNQMYLTYLEKLNGNFLGKKIYTEYRNIRKDINDFVPLSKFIK